jgi:hypothetical protein
LLPLVLADGDLPALAAPDTDPWPRAVVAQGRYSARQRVVRGEVAGFGDHRAAALGGRVRAALFLSGTAHCGDRLTGGQLPVLDGLERLGVQVEQREVGVDRRDVHAGAA